jgi:hypothetical protein
VDLFPLVDFRIPRARLRRAPQRGVPTPRPPRVASLPRLLASRRKLRALRAARFASRRRVVGVRVRRFAVRGAGLDEWAAFLALGSALLPSGGFPTHASLRVGMLACLRSALRAVPNGSLRFAGGWARCQGWLSGLVVRLRPLMGLRAAGAAARLDGWTREWCAADGDLPVRSEIEGRPWLPARLPARPPLAFDHDGKITRPPAVDHRDVRRLARADHAWRTADVRPFRVGAAVVAGRLRDDIDRLAWGRDPSPGPGGQASLVRKR